MGGPAGRGQGQPAEQPSGKGAPQEEPRSTNGGAQGRVAEGGSCFSLQAGCAAYGCGGRCGAELGRVPSRKNRDFSENC